MYLCLVPLDELLGETDVLISIIFKLFFFFLGEPDKGQDDLHNEPQVLFHEEVEQKDKIKRNRQEIKQSCDDYT